MHTAWIDKGMHASTNEHKDKKTSLQADVKECS